MSIVAYSPQAILFGMSNELKSIFFRQLATMVSSGLPLGRAVSTASEVGCRALGKELSKLVDSGSTLSDAMAKYPNHFEAHEVALVHAGEKSGQLDRQLNKLAGATEEAWRTQKKIKGKLLYPVLICHSAVLLPPLFLLVKDGPAAYFRTVLTILVPAYLLFFVSVAAYRFFRLNGGPRRVFDNLLVAMPILGQPVVYSARIKFLDVLANLIEAGFIPGQAIPLAAESCNSFWLRDKVMAAFKRHGNSGTMSTVMKESGAFGNFEVGLVHTGEETGSFVNSIQRAAEALRPEYEAQIHRIMMVTPVVMLFVVGGFVGYQAYTVISGIYAPLTGL